MLLIALVFFASILVQARPFNITHLIVPETVPPGQEEVEIECRYDANFTLLNWFKGVHEFFRYKPGSAPTTRSFPILGVGRVELIACGPTACRLKLGALTEDATGLYKCDIERDAPPYRFASRKAYMEVHGHVHRKPLLEGLAEQFGEGEEMKAYCRGAPDTELRWYINGRELEDLRGSTVLKKYSSRLLFLGIPPTVTVQCAEFKFGKLYGSNQEKARWKDYGGQDERPQEQRNKSDILKVHSIFVCILSLYLLKL